MIRNETSVGSPQTHQWPHEAFAQIAPVIRQSQPVITGRNRDHAGAPLLLAQQLQLVARPTLLEASGDLQVVELAINLTPAEARKVERVWTRRVINDIINALSSSADGFDVDQFASHFGD